ncbi:MAG: hypothetical protein VCD00_04215 [Candidatus Hydrogenedentota bacterium]
MKYLMCSMICMFTAGCAESTDPEPMVPAPGPRIAPLPLAVYQGDGSLVGHTWQSGPLTFIFQPGDNVLVRGGQLVESMPTGAPGTYSKDGGMLELSVLGRTYTGAWDGAVLTLNQQIASYLGETATVYPELVLDYSN